MAFEMNRKRIDPVNYSITEQDTMGDKIIQITYACAQADAVKAWLRPRKYNSSLRQKLHRCQPVPGEQFE